ncbi:hypothetical protein [Streptomyces ipomoeae]|uniref:hypothetical protein n=1 Tax=Streptomyces ipomoeae TaxID=103232 RepID=UPI0015F0EB7F|nr:hypothetical protein [Streptomyces ipomoeae]
MASRQGRKERPINPDDGPVESFAWRLRELRKECGNPTYKEMERRAPYSSSALSGAASGQAPPSLAITLAYVRACLTYAKTNSGQVDAAIEEWTLLRQELEAELKPPPDPDNGTSHETDTPLPSTRAPSLQADSALDEEPANAPPSSSSAPIDGAPEQHPQNTPAPRRFKVLGRRGRQGLAVIGLLILLGLAVLIGKNLARPGSAEAGSGSPGRSPGSSSSAQAQDEQADQVQVDALGPQSRCGPARSGAADVLLRACLRVEDERVLFALKVTNLGSEAVEVTAKLSYVRAGQHHSCQKADGLWHGTVPAHDSYVTDPADCVVNRTQAAYQADGLLALGDTQNWVAHQLSPNAHAYPHDVRWRCKGDVPC